MTKLHIADNASYIKLGDGTVGISFFPGKTKDLCGVGFSHLIETEIGKIVENSTERDPIHTVIEISNLNSAKVLQKMVNACVEHLEGKDVWYGELKEEREISNDQIRKNDRNSQSSPEP